MPYLSVMALLRTTLTLLIFVLVGTSVYAQTKDDALTSNGKYATVDHCSPGGHMKCVYTTCREVFEEGKEGKISKHWWKKSYIGRAYTEKYGKFIGGFYEGLFAVPHYVSMAFVNLSGWIVGKLKRAKKNEKLKNDLTEDVVLDH
ncbi:MAG: hypothetical protein COB85_08320 [Bacteroidetes bacterium]|nr:MAG: hypothetical protein COB85_08320 [Bacteroidota bacterium]